MSAFYFTTSLRIEAPITDVFDTLLHTPSCEGTGSTFNGIELCAIISEGLNGLTIFAYSFMQFREYVLVPNRTSVEFCSYHEP